MRKFTLILTLLALQFGVIWAQIEFDPERDVSIEVTQSTAQVKNLNQNVLKVTLKLPPDVHITSQEAGFFFLEMNENPLFTWDSVVFPPSVIHDEEHVFKGDVTLIQPFKLKDKAASHSSVEVSGWVGYQICTEVEPIYCTPPVEREIKFEINTSQLITETEVKASGTVTNSQNEETGALDENLSIEEKTKRALESGSLIALLWIFLGGVALSFTPCVYPVIPITIAFIGARAEGQRLRGFLLSLVFVLGLALVYSTLGVIAAGTGGVFGLSTQNPWVIGFVTLVFLAMGAGMLGAFELSLPSSIQTKLSSKRKAGFGGALIMGATTGLIAAPCVGPVLVALLGWVSTTGNLFLGFLYLFVFASGLGVLFIVIGTFAGALTALPKAGAWMANVNKVFGVILIAAALYFAKGLIPANWFILVSGLAFLLLAGFMGFFSRLPEGAGTGSKLNKSVSLFVLILGIFFTLAGLNKFYPGVLGVSSAPMPPGHSSEAKSHAGVNWMKTDIDEALQKAQMTDDVVIIDFWAEWCAACKELDHKTFSDPKVYEVMNDNFVTFKFDGTKITDEVKAVWDKFGVKGLPTVLFLDSSGNELERFEAFRTVEEVMPILEKYKNH